DFSWTVTGSSPVAGTYTSRRDFIEGAIQPSQRAFVATDSAHGGDDHYGGKHGRRALGWSCGGEGRPGYDNRYCWVMRMEHGTVKEAVAFFDSAALTDLLECVSP